MKLIRLFFLFFLVSGFLLQAQQTPYKILKGKITGKDHKSYIKVPFSLPKGVTRLTVEFSYTGKNQKTTIDLGLLDPFSFRGWSGGARNKFTISREEATPGYLLGNLPEGKWHLLLGIPNIRTNSKANYEAKIYIEKKPSITEILETPINPSEGWYRGDLHMHSGNSDGNCLSQSGNKIPCPVYKVIESAVKQDLDFMALTDHNSTSQYNALRELQPAFDSILLIPSREITTFYGHANIYGLTNFVNFQVSSPTDKEFEKWMMQVRNLGGLISINHPGIPSGENCMGCGWEMEDTLPGLINVVEVINGGTLKKIEDPDSKLQGWELWHKMLKSGHKVTAIGGSDNHNPLENKEPGAIGYPTTVIYMKELSLPGILEGIKSGRVFIDIEGKKERFVDLEVIAKNGKAKMGNEIKTIDGEIIHLLVETKGIKDGTIEYIVDGVTKPENIFPLTFKNSFKYKTDGNHHFIYVKIKDYKNKTVLISNPVYLK